MAVPKRHLSKARRDKRRSSGYYKGEEVIKKA